MTNASFVKTVLFSVIATAVVVSIAFLGSSSLRAQIPSLPGGLSIPGASSGMSGFAGIDALKTAKDLYAKDKPAYPTPNIAVSGSNVVIAWPTGVVTIEAIAKDGTIHRTILGPPSDKNAR